MATCFYHNMSYETYSSSHARFPHPPIFCYHLTDVSMLLASQRAQRVTSEEQRWSCFVSRAATRAAIALSLSMHSAERSDRSCEIITATDRALIALSSAASVLNALHRPPARALLLLVAQWCRHWRAASLQRKCVSLDVDWSHCASRDSSCIYKSPSCSVALS